MERGEFPITEIEMPDLSGLRNNLGRFILNVAFVGGGPHDPVDAALVLNFVRLVDQAIKTYSMCREELVRFVESTQDTPGEVPLGAYYTAITYMETCVGSVRRALLFGMKIRKRQTLPGLPRELSVFRQFVADRVSAVRDSIEHIDKDIIRGEVKEGYRCLTPKVHQIEIGSEVRLSYTDLSGWIKELHQVATQLALIPKK